MDIYSALFGASFITLIVLFGIAIVTLVGKWKVYAKLGMPGWYSLIPVFSDYKLCERVRGGEENKTFLMAYLIVLICSWVLCWAPAVNWILIIAQFVMNIIVLNDLAHTFGKGFRNRPDDNMHPEIIGTDRHFFHFALPFLFAITIRTAFPCRP
ncbi:hypothetical protein [Coprococcus comes]|uniref:Uncharacterized protein n=1 Tax=Coprococcus comes TaxID=410072 RepID=A0A849XNQ3_9FIRM|nr:hypothetical protein [Coprococcus comes]NUN86147.1 hypothetical protein [Coprococcus comes]